MQIGLQMKHWRGPKSKGKPLKNPDFRNKKWPVTFPTEASAVGSWDQVTKKSSKIHIFLNPLGKMDINISTTGQMESPCSF